MNRQLFNAMVAQYGKETIVSNGNDIITWSGGAHCYLPSLKFYGLSQQYGTPTPDNPAYIGGFTGPIEVVDVIYTTTPILHGIGEYKDEWDYVTGKGVRRIGTKVLDGTESWGKYHWGNGKGYYSYRTYVNSFNVTEKLQCLCTHYPSHHSHAELFYGEIEAAYVGGVTDTSSWLIIGNSFPTVAEFKAFLAEQYANGTPVTVYYVRAEPKPFEERPDYQTYIPIPNDSGSANIIDGGMNTPFEVTYITHS